MADSGMQLYRLVLDDEGNSHTVLKVAFDAPPGCASNSNDGYYNIVMVDVSASMGSWWDSVMKYFNELIAPTLTGHTDIYTFGSEIRFRRSGTILKNCDNDSSMTNLTGALKVINDKVTQSSVSNVRVILITDGHHNSGSREPTEEIANMAPIFGKTVEVYLLGLGMSFPVGYSVDIRSRMHTGSSSCPPIFWCQNDDSGDVENQNLSIQEEIKKGLFKVKLSIPGKIVPNVSEEKLEASAGEFIYFDKEPEEILKTLSITLGSDKIPLNEQIITASAETLVYSLYKQWNSVLIQMHRKNMNVPMENFVLMENSFRIQMLNFKTISGDSVRKRIDEKFKRTLTTEFSTQMNQSRSMISVESKFKNEIELAEAIMKTTVQSKFDTKLLKFRGHSDEEWDKDMKIFKEVYLSVKDEIKKLPSPELEDCCRVMMSSFLMDLQDSDIIEILDQNKLDFLATFNFTGIPILAPVRDSAQINPWTLNIKSILVSPFEIISHRVLECSYEMGLASSENETDKSVTLQTETPNTTFNAVVPIIPKNACEILQKLVRTNVFSVGATFCILKNALIVDHNCHLAALACVWLKTITENPYSDRKYFIKNRIENVESTANLYTDRKVITTFMDALCNKPELCMVTETELTAGVTLKCESIVKVTFFIYLSREKICSSNKVSMCKIVHMVLTEFLGRCLTNYDSRTPYIDLLLPKVPTNNQQDFIADMIQKVVDSLAFTGDQLLEACFAPEDLKSLYNEKIKEKVSEILESGGGMDLKMAPNTEKVKHLRNFGSAGNVMWKHLRAWATELTQPSQDGATPPLLPQELEDAFSDQKTCLYLHHALKHRQSQQRWTGGCKINYSNTAISEINTKLMQEQESIIKRDLYPSVVARVQEMWQEALMKAHATVARPMTPQEIVRQAIARGIEVTDETFHTVYKYRSEVGLCRNCCHMETCPHFLRPDRRFNCHLQAERKYASYPHQVHNLVSKNRNNPEESVKRILIHIDETKKAKENFDKKLTDDTSHCDSVEGDTSDTAMEVTSDEKVYDVKDLVQNLDLYYDSMEQHTQKKIKL